MGFSFWEQERQKTPEKRRSANVIDMKRKRPRTFTAEEIDYLQTIEDTASQLLALTKTLLDALPEHKPQPPRQTPEEHFAERIRWILEGKLM